MQTIYFDQAKHISISFNIKDSSYLIGCIRNAIKNDLELDICYNEVVNYSWAMKIKSGKISLDVNHNGLIMCSEFVVNSYVMSQLDKL
jgi:hypothetical protein